MSPWRAIAALLSAISILYALACASVPPPTESISQAELALREAESVKAVEYAPLEMRIAREKLEEAKALVIKGESDDMMKARRLAEEALVQAELAYQTSRTAIAQHHRDEAQKTIDALREGSGL